MSEQKKRIEDLANTATAHKKLRYGGRPSKAQMERVQYNRMLLSNGVCLECSSLFLPTLPMQRVCNECRDSLWAIWQSRKPQKHT